MVYGPQFSELLKELRHTLGRSQGLGKALGFGEGVVASWEQRRRIPSLRNLFGMSARLAAAFPARPIPSQAQFLAAWLEAQGFDADEALLEALRSLGPRSVSLTDLSWLSAYVFVGDRREHEAQTRLDCLIAPAAISDLRWLCGLRLDPGTELILDKELTARPWDELVKRYGDRDIVSISSGGVNAMTGLLVDEMVFRFDVQAGARHAYRTFIRDMGHLEDEASLEAFRRCLAAADSLGSSQDPEALLREAGLGPEFLPVAQEVATLLGGLTAEQFTSLFRQAVIDPFMRTQYQPAGADYAVISFARHPFGAEDRVALVIAGTNGPATAGAVQLLATEGIEGRPLGAVVRIRKPGTGRAPKAKVVTTPYEPKDIVQSIDMILNGGSQQGPPNMVREIFMHWTDKELDDWKALVISLGDLLAKR
jgi:hypothetical protein